MDPSLLDVRGLTTRQARGYGVVVVLLGVVILAVGVFLCAAALQVPALQAWLMPGVEVVPRSDPLGVGLVLILAWIIAMGVLAVAQGAIMVATGRRQMTLLRLMLVLLGLFFAIGFVLIVLNGQSWRLLNS